jgi:hypothetical protein
VMELKTSGLQTLNHQQNSSGTCVKRGDMEFATVSSMQAWH